MTLAQALVQARRTHTPLVSADWAEALRSPDDAYATLDAVAQALGWFADGPATAWKSGGPSREAVLTHAPLPPAGVRPSPAAYPDLPLRSPHIEAEVALRLGQAVSPAQAAGLAPGMDPAAIDALIDAMTVSIEVVDFRWAEGMQAPALLRLADLQSHGALVLGPWVPYARRDWAAQVCEVDIGPAPTVRRTGSHSLGDPAWLLPAWLRHATRHGQTVPAGTVVTTGTWVGVLPARAGDAVEVRFDGIGVARVQI